MSLFDLIGNQGVIINSDENLTVDAAIDLTCSTLLASNKIEASYVEAIKQKHKDIGAYYVLAPKIA
ncbi:PTS sugar transporter subunit IIA, partial [Vibrio breoganii]